MRLKIALAALPLLLVACSSGEAPSADGSASVTASAEASESIGGEASAKEGEDSATEAADGAPADGDTPSSEASEVAQTAPGEDAESGESSRLAGVPEDFPAALPLPTGIARVSSSTSSGDGSEKTWALSFGLAGSEWETPCVDYSGALSAKGYRSALSERSSQYVSETLVGQDIAVSMACEEGRMVILVGPAL